MVYSQDGYRFSLILNGVLQNQKPSTNVKVTSLNATNYQAKLIFENKMPDANGNVYLMWEGNPIQNTEFSYAVVNAKGKLKLRFKSKEPIPMETTQQVQDPQQLIVVYTPIEIPLVKVETTTTTNTVQTTGNVGGPNININITNPLDINMQTGGNTSTTSTYSTTTTTTTTTNNSANNVAQHQTEVYHLEGYSGTYGCPYPMSNKEFESAKQSIASKGFDDSRLTIAKQIIGSNCLLCSQIKELMLIMSFEETKLELAKFSWHHNLDKGNYYKLNDAFTFESSIEALNTYTQSH